MAGAIAERHAEAILVLCHVVCVMASDSEPIRLEVIDPLTAAPASRALVDINHRDFRGCPSRLGKTANEKTGNNIFHTRPLFTIEISMEWGSPHQPDRWITFASSSAPIKVVGASRTWPLGNAHEIIAMGLATP
jgi:hypothetical protein